MGLQTGGELARTTKAVISPGNLGIIAYHIVSPLIRGQLYLRIQDVRELSSIGFIIDSIDEFVAPGDVIKLDEIVDLHFDVAGMNVRDEKGNKVGKVIDYTIDVDTFEIQQLSVRRPVLRTFGDAELVIHRAQIIEINDDAIVIHSKAEAPEHTRLTSPGSYINPFRKTETVSESITIES